MHDLVPLVDVPLDAAQQRAAFASPERATLVLGEAGHGKTTVALHRLAHLARAAQTGRFRAAVVVPAEGLRRLVERALVRLGVDVPALTFDAFARRQARRAFPDLPRRESADATPATIRLKRDAALQVAVARLALRAPGAIDDDGDAAAPPGSAHAVRGDLQHLFGDRELLEEVVRASQGRIPAHAVAETLDHTRVQFGLTGEDAWSHVEDRARLVPVDRRSLDDGTPDADAASVDVEDYAVLFALDRARASRLGVRPTRPRSYDCLVIDEAQELAPIELELLGRSLARGGTLVVAGDADQQLDAAVSFPGWDAAMRALRRQDHERVVLDVGYRCPPEVSALARSVLGRSPPPEATTVERFPTASALHAWLGATAERLLDQDPRARVGVFTREGRAARRVADGIRAHVPARLVWGGDFGFAPGVDVTTIDQVRGLEFDHVLVADASAAVYADDERSRRALYVAITRARRTVRLAAVGSPTPLVSPR